LTTHAIKTKAAAAGLAIERHIARSHGGDITLGDLPQGGLPAAVRVPV
jgi:two-component system, OmpR family, osmolarity sensor histidine kinase EnvZ